MQKTLYILLGLVLLSYALWNFLDGNFGQTKNAKPKTEIIRLLAVGDINLGRQTGQKILKGDTTYAFINIKDKFAKYDIVFGNLESQLADLGGETQSPTNEYRFAGPPAGADGLKSAGVSIVSVANNHMWDYGKKALMETLDNLDRTGVNYAGASKETSNVYAPKIIEIKGKKIAFFAITNLLNGYEKSGALEYVAWADMNKLRPEIEKVRPNVDFVIVPLHDGTEYKSEPNKSTVTLTHQIIDSGADIVFGGHPHVMQGIEKYKNKLIFYSLGNFAFWQPFGYWTEHSFVADIELGSNGEVTYNPLPVDAGWQPKLSVGDDITKILQQLATLSDKLNLGGSGGVSAN